MLGDFDARLSGTYDLDGDRLTFDFGQEADVFIDETEWTLDDGVIREDGDDINVVLRRQ